MHATALRKSKLTTGEISLNNKTGVYTNSRTLEGGTYIKGVENGESFFEIDGKKMTADEVPEKYQKYPYSLSEYYAKIYKEHHTFQFSFRLVLKEAGAIPLEGVGEKHVFGKPCVSIKFDGYSNSYEKGYYNGAITFYVIPDDGYRLHAVHTDNGKGLA